MHISLLFPKRITVSTAESDLFYDATAQLNMVRVDGQFRPAIDQPQRLPTNSKTAQAPHDDDPDPAREDLY
jgi:hypothetical protein